MNKSFSTQAVALVLAVVVSAGTLLGVDHLAQHEYADNATATATTDVAVQQVIVTAHRPARG